MNLESLKKQLEIDEGVKHDIYLDHLVILLLGSVILLLRQTQKVDKLLALPSRTKESHKHLNQMSYL